MDSGRPAGFRRLLRRRALRARSAARARRVADRTVIDRLRSQPPLVLRETAGGLTLVNGAGGPLGGDHTKLDVDVCAGAALTIGSAAAVVAQPGAGPGPSRATVHLRVRGNGALRWTPEPLVVARGAEHRSELSVELDAASRLLLVETIVLGRHREPPGLLHGTWRVRRDGVALLAQDTVVGCGAPPGWNGPAVLGGAHVLANALVVDPHRPPDAPVVPGCEVLTLDGPAVLIVVASDTTLDASRILNRALHVLERSAW